MTNHKLDEEVEDILQHWGIKGMKWDVHRTPEQIAAAGPDGTGGGAADVDDDDESDDDNDSLLDRLGDAKSFLSGISKDVKKAGKNLLNKLFGQKTVKMPKGWTLKRVKNLKKMKSKDQKEFNTMMKIASRSKNNKDYKKNVKAYKHATRKGGTTTTTLGVTTYTVKKDGYGKGVIERRTPLYGSNVNGEAERKSSYKKEAERKRKARSKNPITRWGK